MRLPRRAIKGYEGLYAVTADGHVFSERRKGTCGGEVVASVSNAGYLTVSLYRNSKREHVNLHRLVAESFLGPRPSTMEVNHIDGDKLNNRAENLEYVTRTNNLRHSYALGLRDVAGEAHPRARLSEEDVRDIRGLRGVLLQREVAEKYGISRGHVGHIQAGDAWKTVLRSGGDSA